jgi:hypothetical protein
MWSLSIPTWMDQFWIGDINEKKYVSREMANKKALYSHSE